MPPYPPPHPRQSAVQVFIVALLLLAATALTVARVDAQEPDHHIAGSHLGVGPDFVTAETTVFTPGGTSTGPAGIQDYLDSLRRDYPEARFEAGEAHVVGRLIVVDWQGTVDGSPIHSGRTLILMEDGRVARLWFLDFSFSPTFEGEQAWAA